MRKSIKQGIWEEAKGWSKETLGVLTGGSNGKEYRQKVQELFSSEQKCTDAAELLIMLAWAAHQAKDKEGYESAMRVFQRVAIGRTMYRACDLGRP